MEQIIEKLKGKARNSWSGEIGEQRAIELEKYLRGKLEEYSNALEISQEEILKSWEEDRTYSAINYYQEANQPPIKGDKVKVFETVEEMLQVVGERKFRCPSCNHISTNPYECNSGEEMSEGKICDWKVYGLFGDLGKGTFIYVKDKLKGETIFTPISWE
ncbi:hypothetical protein [Virgibacillus alimentarius]|uniref:hypothetical protein n=1 Tax=Virgibacillus alimentarius TaxID=698769 RepID=UPI0004934308|nr:hypothetical protein [Virgibacillus alimentarius]